MRPFCTTWLTLNCTPKALLWAVYLRRMSINHNSLKKNSMLLKEKKGISPRNENYMSSS